MIEKKLRTLRFFKYLKISLISGFVSVGINYFINFYSAPFAAGVFFQVIVISFCTGFAGPFILSIVYDWLQYTRTFKRLPFLIQMLTGIILFVLIIITAYSSFILLFTGNVQTLLANLPWALILGSIIALWLMLTGIFREFLGKGFFTNLIKGLYRKVKVEKVVVMFVDLVNSTKIGETLSPESFFNLLNDFLRIVDLCCTYYRGELHKYLGDGAMLIWDVTPEGLTKVLDFISGFQEEIAEKAASLKSAYGVEINYTIGIHSGNVIKGGLGSEKREIGFWGDTINTASRIQGICKQYNVSVLLSTDFLTDVKTVIPVISKNFSPRSVGETVLRGKAGTYTLYTV